MLWLSPLIPMQITLLAVVTLLPASVPKAVLLHAESVVTKSIKDRKAVLLSPVLLLRSALTPLAVLYLPVVLL